MYKRLAKQLALYGVTTGFAVSSILSSSVSAITMDTGTMLYNNSNGVFFTNPNSAACASSSGDTGSDIDASEAAEAIFKFFISTNFAKNSDMPLSAVQAAGFMGNFYQESRYNPAIIQGGKAYDEAKALSGVGGYAFGLVQWDTGRRIQLMKFAKYKKADWKDLKLQLEFIKFELDGERIITSDGSVIASNESAILRDSDFRSSSLTIREATLLVRKTYERPGAPHDANRIAAAQKAYNTYKSLAPDAGAAISGGTDGEPPVCDTGVSAGNGNIAETARRLSWPERGHGLNGKPEYIEALKTTGVNKLGDSCSMAGNSCDAFLATVLRLTGVDEQFPCCGSYMQGMYMKNSDKYEAIGTFSRGSEKDALSKLAPGDLMYRTGHVKIYLGDGREAGASHCKRTAEQNGLIFDGTYYVYRAKVSGASAL